MPVSTLRRALSASAGLLSPDQRPANQSALFGQYDFAASGLSNQLKIWIDGALPTLASFNSVASDSFVTATLYLGARNGDALRCNGQFRRAISLPATVDSADLALIDAWLAEGA